MTAPVIRVGDWVLICETHEKAEVLDVFDDGERFLVSLASNEKWPFPRKMHVSIEKVRKIKTPKPELKWQQPRLF